MDSALFHHFALPQRLPGAEDNKLDEVEALLVDHLVRAADRVRRPAGRETHDYPLRENVTSAWSSVANFLTASKTVNRGGLVNSAKLRTELGCLGVGGALLLYIRSQNAALFVYRLASSPDQVTFEAFEASAKNEDVLAADGALEWDFPGIAVEVPYSTFVNRDFQASLATFLEQASIETTKPFAGRTSKAGVDIHEYRDTANPTMISSMLMAVLEESGRRVAARKLRKNVRDDVCWRDGARKPWRRSPYWLVLRVAAARYLSLTLGEQLGRFEYKFMMCCCFATFLRDVQIRASPEITVDQLNFLKTKLCRRFAKLETFRNHVKSSFAALAPRIELLFGSLAPAIVAGPVDNAERRVHREWEQFKAKNTKSIEPLRKRAHPANLSLSLMVSGATLDRIRAATNRMIHTPQPKRSPPPNFAPRRANEQFTTYAQPFLKITGHESALHQLASTPGVSANDLSQKLHQYVEIALPKYSGNSEQLSILILNCMDVWMKIDEGACRRFPLLAQYRPIFAPEALDVLHLAAYKEMARLQSIQNYLRLRVETSIETGSVFEGPTADCFARRYYDECDDSNILHALHEEIERVALLRKDSKYQEWEKKTAQHEALTRQVNESTCVFTVNKYTGRETHASNFCPRCHATRQLENLRIKIYEHPLPSDEFMAKVAVFEIACPPEFATYRDVTWMLVDRLGAVSNPGEPVCRLGEYSELQPHIRRQPTSFTLASSTKSFLRSHYGTLSFPVGWDAGRDGVCKPNGLRWGYYDTRSNSWTRGAPTRPSFAHHFDLQMPRGFPIHFLSSRSKSKTLTRGEGPSSYEAVATQVNCPSGLSPHEFMAFKTLASGFARRWVTILVELGSTNINWSGEAATMLMHHLALQCGPASESKNPLRLTHAVFGDATFVKKLLDQVNSRFKILKDTVSWRETNIMDTLITLALRILRLAKPAGLDSVLRDEAADTLFLAREICVLWIRQLRQEIQTAPSSPNSRNLQHYALMAALLCRRTFVVHLDNWFDFDEESLEEYIESTLAIQENMVLHSIEELPPLTLRHLVSSIKLSYDIQDVVMSKIKTCQEGLQKGLKHFWPEADRMTPGKMEIISRPDGWVCFDIPQTELESYQYVHLDILLGCLLVNGKPVGKLPQDSQDSTVIKELFGDQPLRCFQSSIPGMTYTLANKQREFTVHVGYDGTETIILAKPSSPSSPMLRFINREIFESPLRDRFDLPGPLVHGRIHWMNLQTGDVYITPLRERWEMGHQQTWTINRQRARCERRRPHGKTEAVLSPQCKLFRNIASILEGLVPRGHLLVSQPLEKGSLQVLIQSLGLMFFVNPSQRLYSPQLRLEIDPNQDAGTWYGLDQKLICRSPENPFQRTVLVPLGGDITTRRSGCHVTVRIGRSDRYGKFAINDTIGRIDCAAEPQLLYTKALLHAYTSFPIPDPLTGRTGAEESLHWLQSGACSPWTVLGHEVAILARIASLTPCREYYPLGRKVMRVDRWNDSLTSHIQHPLYRRVVDEILALSEELESFTASPLQGQPSPVDLISATDEHLTLRAWRRQQLYERPTSNHTSVSNRIPATVYVARDQPSSSESTYSNIMEMSHLIRKRPAIFDTPFNLAIELGKGDLIGGYGSKYGKVSISDQMSTDIRENWGPLVELCRADTSIYSLVFVFAALCFGGCVKNTLLKALVSFITIPELRSLELPKWPSYSFFRPDKSPRVDDIARLMSPFKMPAPTGSADELGNLLTAKQRRKVQAQKEKFEWKSEQDCRRLAEFLINQWPCLEPSADGFPDKDVQVYIGLAMEVVLPEWSRLFRNYEFNSHMQHVQHILDKHRSEYSIPTSPPYSPDAATFHAWRAEFDEVPSLGDLLAKAMSNSAPAIMMPRLMNHGLTGQAWTPLASIPRDGRELSAPRQFGSHGSEGGPQHQTRISAVEQRKYIEELRAITERLGQSKSLVRQNYAQDLLGSLEAFETLKKPRAPASSFLWKRELSTSQGHVVGKFDRLTAAVQMPTPKMSLDHIRWLQRGGLWPAITTVTLLEHLRCGAKTVFGLNMRNGLIKFGLALTRLQRDIRLNDCYLAGDVTRFQDEEANSGHYNWDPAQESDWLLLEIESNVLIRPDQVDVARATITPQSGSNSVLQMNMGQGKTSCIMPMAAASLADGNSLVRVIVPKALLLQTAQLLQSRLGGMLNRRICHVPFSRRTVTTEQNVRRYFGIHKRLLKATGVMLCLPEHSLSFMLSGQQRVLDDKMDQAKPMIKVQSWLRSVCRDILDESDYTLATRTQLIYPSGSQVAVNGHPHRWQVIEAILSLVNQHLYGLEASFPQSIEVVRRLGGGFPLVYFLRRDAEDELLVRLMSDITTREDILPMRSFTRQERLAIKDFLAPRHRKLRADTASTIRALRPDRPHIKQMVYLLRGLLVNRILIMTLKKRWNVQYGLRPNSDPVAVPYHAKGVPSEQSEWGHPDVAILFTCLVFYYDGVSEAQLQKALSRVKESDDPATEYDKWVYTTPDFPLSLRSWNAINVEDASQINGIWRAVRYQVVVIDYFLNNFVFPQHAKQFKVKLQSSGWDIPQFSAEVGEVQQHALRQGARPLTTGFSGTNDNRNMLPLTIRQADLKSLSHTNAEVLTYLLHDRSRECKIITDVRGKRATERDLLHMLKTMGISILIDAGALILEMDNETLARTWLDIDGQEAALYFDANNKAMIISKTGKRTPLLASPYADDLSKCLVYLDEAHTRGTDLKFPLNARGGLTLGQGQTKDHTVQAAMRLRQLGTSQSITFFIPPEVHQVILDLQGKTTHDNIDSHDVICWMLDNSCDGIEQLQPLYYSQGIDFCRRTQASIDNSEFLTDVDQQANYVSSIKLNELQTLQAMYEPKKKVARIGDFKSSHPSVAAFARELNARRKGFQDTGRAVHGSALQEVEQEREVAVEAEVQRQPKKPRHYEALGFPGLSRDLAAFVRSGRPPVDSNAMTHYFQFMAATLLGKKHKIAVKGGHVDTKLFVSTEFQRTVRLYTDLSLDNFLRPVSWVLWSEVVEAAVVVIPEEAEAILRMMQTNDIHPKVHLITYASPVTRKMLCFNSLTFLTFPPMPPNWKAPQWLKTGLGLLAGRIHFEWEEYESLSELLGVQESSISISISNMDGIEDVDTEVSDGEENKEMTVARTFCPRPLVFLQEWLALRRQGQDFSHTPMGFMVQDKPLHANHPLFNEATASTGTNGTAALGGGSVGLVNGSKAEDCSDDDFFDGVDDMGANVGDDDNEEEEQGEETEASQEDLEDESQEDQRYCSDDGDTDSGVSY
ncbi:hypothetical protein B0T16DRAFT_354150 [Cercophora newfieldiana]|uniref:ubiquitinyl hydrolase 1 n=1 Tax=Cercophora newfieldiana TaxID=92897 RepID=A0AA39XZ98_9PEZI|nr:hypothetical protein B0T16DRAFT_354150 [Cercophora newfieldiana]